MKKSEKFNPDAVIVQKGTYNQSFSRSGAFIPSDIIIEGIKHYRNKCEDIRHLAEDLEKAGWVFTSSIFSTPSQAIVVCAAFI